MDPESMLAPGFLFRVLKKHILPVIAAAVLSGAAGFCISEYVIPKKYESSALLYIENNRKASEAVNINDINAAQKLVNTCQIIFKSDTMTDRLISELGLSYTRKELDKMITADSVNGTEVMRLCVESSDPEEAQLIVNKLVELSVEEFLRVVKSGSVELIDMGRVSEKPSSPNVPLLTAVFLILGAAVAYVAGFLGDVFDTAVKADDNIAKQYDIPVFAEIEDAEAAAGSRYGSYRSYGGYGKSKPSSKNRSEGSFTGNILSENTPFSITEAYNAARTNLMFAVSGGSKKIIAFTSANPSEGKSTVSANFAISFANAGHRALLVECDLRRPTVAKKFGLTAGQGLSSVLGGFCTAADAVRKDVVSGLDILPAGDIPPNPTELLGSEAMKRFLEGAAEKYDYIFLDTPPVNVVTDSQLMNGTVSGLVFIVKEGSTAHPDIRTALENIRLASGKPLGFVKTFCIRGKRAGYGKRYSRKYKYGYYEYKSDKEK